MASLAKADGSSGGGAAEHERAGGATSSSINSSGRRKSGEIENGNENGNRNDIEYTDPLQATSPSNPQENDNLPLHHPEDRERRRSSSNTAIFVGSGGIHNTSATSKMGSSSDERRGPRDVETESSADESTNIMRKSARNNMSYQGTATSPQRVKNAGSGGGGGGGGGERGVKKRGRRREDENEEDEAAEHEGWWGKVLSKYGSIELENKGSVARDHLALERTFLAWLRTSLAFASIGIAITQLFRLNVSSSSSSDHTDRYARLRSMGKPLGATFLGISIVMLFIGFHRYFESQHWIIRGKFPASRGSIIIVALVTFALMVTSLVVVVVVEPGVREK